MYSTTPPILLLLSITCINGQGSDQQYKCDWTMELFNRQRNVPTKYVTPDKTIFQDITLNISNVDLTPDDSDARLFAYDNNIRIRLNCPTNKADEQSYVAQGGTPIVSVYYPPQTTYDQTPVGPVVRELYGAIIDTTPSEQIEVNSPAWVVPLPLDSCHTIMGVNTRGEGGGEILPNTRSFEVLVASLTDDSGTPDATHMGSAAPAPPNLNTILVAPRPPPTFVPVYNSGYVYGPLDDNGVYLFAYRDFSDGQDAKFLLNTKLVAGPGPCTCLPDQPRLMAALPQRILIYGKDGLTEVRGKFVHMHSTDNTVIRESSIQSSVISPDVCISQLIVNNQIDLLQEWTAVGIGACDNVNQVFMAEVKHNLDGPMNFTQLSDLDLNTLCGGDCTLVTAVVWAEGISKVTVLSQSDINREYYLIDYTIDRFTGASKTEVTARIGYDQNESPGLGEAVVLSLVGEKQPGLGTGTGITLSLTGLSLRPYSSNDIFIWGNRILYSPDRGRTVLFIPWPPTEGDTNLAVLALPVSQSGMYAVLVQNSNPPAGESPTQIWASFTSKPAELYQIYDTTDFYVALHHQQSDQNAYIWSPDTVIISMWWQQDIYQEDTLKLLGYSPSLENGLNGIQNVELRAYLLLEMVRDSLLDHTDLGSTITGNDPRELLWANHRPDKCPFENMVFQMPPDINTLKLQDLQYKPPRAFDGVNETILYTEASILAYHAVVIYLDQLQDSAITASYLNTEYDDTTEQWQGEMQTSVPYRDYTFQFGFAPGGFDIDIDDYSKVYPHYEDGSQPQITELPDNIYIGHKETFWFFVRFIMRDLHFYWDYTILSDTNNQYGAVYKIYFYNEDFNQEGYDNTLSVTVTDPNLVDVKKELVLDDRGDILTYRITITDKGSMPLSVPGANLVPVGLQLTAHNTPFRCYTDYTQFGHTPLGLQRTNVIVGCAPQLRIQFDAVETVKAVGTAGFKYFDCPLSKDPKMPCFYFNTEFLPRFRIQDLLTGSSKGYDGKYSLRIIGGSAVSVEDIERFTDDQVFNYNNKNAKGSGTVFGHSSGQYTEDGWPLFTAGSQSVVWLCLSESPCADVNPKFPLPPEYFFLVRFSNIGTGEDSTNCNLQLDFVVRVHGLPINFYKKSLPLFLGTMVLMALYIFVYYLCHRKNDTVYNKMIAFLGRIKKKISPANQVDDDFLAEYRANYQKKKMIAQKVSAVRRVGETIELGLSYQGLSYLRASHMADQGDAKLPDAIEEEDDDDVILPPTIPETPYLTSFALTSQPQQKKQKAEGFNPMKGKAQDVQVRKKELFLQAEELLQEEEPVRQEIQHEDDDGPPPEVRTIRTVRRMSRTVKVPKSDVINAAMLRSDSASSLPGQPKKVVVKKIIRKTTQDGKVVETVVSNNEAAGSSHDPEEESRDNVKESRDEDESHDDVDNKSRDDVEGESRDETEESRDQQLRRESVSLVNAAVEEAKKSLSQEFN